MKNRERGTGSRKEKKEVRKESTSPVRERFRIKISIFYFLNSIFYSGGEVSPSLRTFGSPLPLLLRGQAPLKSPSPIGASAAATVHFSLFSFLFSLFSILASSCAYSAPAQMSFYNNGIAVPLIAHSKAAEAGIIELGRNVQLNYELENAETIPPDSAIVIGYTLSNTQDAAADKEHSGVTINFAEGVSFELPLEFSFLGIDAIPQEVYYVMPVNIDKLKKFNIVNKAAEHKATDKTAAGAQIALRSISVEKRMLGFELKGSTITLSPFVYIDKDANNKDANLLFINPEKQYAIKDNIDLTVTDITQGSFFISRYTNAGFVRKYRYDAPDIKGANNITVPRELFPANPYPFVFSGTASSVVLRPEVPRKFPVPIPCDPGVIISVQQDTWRDPRFEVYRWDIFPSVLIFDTASYEMQSKLFKRLAFFAEKKGYRGKIVSDEVMENQHGWNAHDYSAEKLAEFFNAANRSSVQLGPEERELEAILIANGIIKFDAAANTYKAGEGAIVSISRESSWELRVLFITHECFHGIFFIDKDFRDFSAKQAAEFDDVAKNFIRSYFDYMNYDMRDNYLWVNEFMAYCLQQPAPAAGEYFGKYLAEKIASGKNEQRRAMLPEKDEESGFWPAIAEPFAKEAAAFSNYVKKRWGLSAGRIWRIHPLKPAE